MRSRHVLVLPALALFLASSLSFAQADDDDLLAPLTPVEKAGKKKKKKDQPGAPGTDSGPISKTGLQVELFTPGPGAKLFVDNLEVGPVAQNDAPRPLTPGTHKVVVKRVGYKDFNATVSARAGAVVHVQVALEPVSAVVSIESEPNGADVLVDGGKLGVTPMHEVVLAPGSHEVTIRHEGFTPSVQTLTVRAGKEYELHASFKPGADRPERDKLTPISVSERSPLEAQPQAAVASAGPSIFGQWYFWAGVAVVAAGATTAVMVATQPKSLTPNDICGGACTDTINKPALIHF